MYDKKFNDQTTQEKNIKSNFEIKERKKEIVKKASEIMKALPKPNQNSKPNTDAKKGTHQGL